MSMSKGEFSLYSYPSPPKKTFISKTLRKDTYTIFPLIDPNDRNKQKKKKKIPHTVKRQVAFYPRAWFPSFSSPITYLPRRNKRSCRGDRVISGESICRRKGREIDERDNHGGSRASDGISARVVVSIVR